VIVSAPASAALPAPVVPLAPSPDSKNSAASKTTPFNDFFDSLTQFEDTQNDGGPGQQGAAASKSSAKNELSANSGAGREQTAVVLPVSPSLPNPSVILKQIAILPHPADSAAPDSNASLDKEASVLQPASPADQSAVASLPMSSPTTPGPQRSHAPSQSSASAPPAPATSARYPLFPGPLPPGTAGLEMATVASIRQAISGVPAKAAATTVAVPAPIATPAKAQVTKTPLEAESLGTAASVGASPNIRTSADLSTSAGVEPARTQTPGPTPTISKPLAANSVSSLEPFTATPVPDKPVLEAILAGESQLGTTPQAVPKSSPAVSSVPVRDTIATPEPQPTGLRVGATEPVAQPSTKLSTESGKASVDTSVLIESALPVKSPSPAVPPPQSTSDDERTSIEAGTPAVPISEPVPMRNASSNSTLQPATASQPAPQPTPANAPVDRQTTSTAESTDPASSVSPAEKQPDPTLAAPMAPSTSLPAPLPADHEVMDRAPETSSPSVAQHQAPSVTPTPKSPLLPEAENFAFAVRMLGLAATDSTATDSKAPVTTSDAPVTQVAVTQTKGTATQPQASNLQQAAPPDNQTSSGPQRETQPTAIESGKPDAGAPNQPDLLKAQPSSGVTPHSNDAPVLQAPEIGSSAAASEPVEAARPNLPLAAQETHISAPELPRTSGSSEILLHLTGNDETSAAIRVADRAGSVNVSVHASDPVLRESLRSNLGELSTQLNAQGWKADVVKSAAVATHSESQQDSRSGGQRGSQQQSSGGERQPQRDRRTNGGQWQQELDQQTTGGDALPGGNG
jgi:hypothetical protein